MEQGNALLKWLGDNPEATNMGIGFLKSLREEPQQRGRAGSEIAKTQYGYLLGQGVGDISKAQGPSMADRLMQGYVAGSQQRQQGDMNAAIKDMLTAKAIKDRTGAVSEAVGVMKDVNGTPEHQQAVKTAETLGSTYIEDPAYRSGLQEQINALFNSSFAPGARPASTGRSPASQQAPYARPQGMGRNY